jgi:hypothetical protein
LAEVAKSTIHLLVLALPAALMVTIPACPRLSYDNATLPFEE